MARTDARAEDSGSDWQQYNNSKSSYSMKLPPTWTAKEKAGADALFEDPAKKSTNAGVTVAPVRVRAIQDFGDVDSVGAKLLESEKAKVRGLTQVASVPRP